MEALPQVAFDWLSLGSYASGVEDDAGALPPPDPLDHPDQTPVVELPAPPDEPDIPEVPVPYGRPPLPPDPADADIEEVLDIDKI